MRDFVSRLKGGHPNSLGNTLEAVDEIFTDHALFDELFNCYFSDDEVVRLRTSNAVKRVCKAHKQVLFPYIDRLLTEIAAIDQASTQWTLANLFDILAKDMTGPQKEQAQEIMKNNLANHEDWIVLNNSIETLGKWAKKDEVLKEWMRPHLDRLSKDSRKSVARRAEKHLKILS